MFLQKQACSLSLTSVKEDEITQKFPFIYENGTNNSKLDTFVLRFKRAWKWHKEHSKYFSCLGREHKKREN